MVQRENVNMIHRQTLQREYFIPFTILKLGKMEIDFFTREWLWKLIFFTREWFCYEHDSDIVGRIIDVKYAE